jgi:hypothetical protein
MGSMPPFAALCTDVCYAGPSGLMLAQKNVLRVQTAMKRTIALVLWRRRKFYQSGHFRQVPQSQFVRVVFFAALGTSL